MEPALMEMRLAREFTKSQTEALVYIITEAFNELVKTKDFRELKDIVQRLAEAQKRTECKIAELAEAQRKTDEHIKATDEHIKALVKGLSDTRTEVASLGKNMSYALENEAFRYLPGSSKP